jgi:hypothetical protein
MSIRRRTILTNTASGTVTAFRKRFAAGESFDIPPTDLLLWRDVPTVSGLIADGTLEVGNTETTFILPDEGLKWFYNHPTELPTTSGGGPGTPIEDDEFLTINRARFGFGKNGNTSGAYLRVEGAASTKTGHVMMRDARLTGIAIYYPSGASDKRFEIRKNGDPTPLVDVMAYEEVVFIQDDLSVDFNKGDRIQAFVTSSGQSVADPNLWCEVGWRFPA